MEADQWLRNCLVRLTGLYPGGVLTNLLMSSKPGMIYYKMLKSRRLREFRLLRECLLLRKKREAPKFGKSSPDQTGSEFQYNIRSPTVDREQEKSKQSPRNT